MKIHEKIVCILVVLIVSTSWFYVIDSMVREKCPTIIAVNSSISIPASVKHSIIVKAGQIWGWEDGDKNPFEEKHYDYLVVAVKDEYVKYYATGQETYGEWASYSDKVENFIRYKKLIKDVNQKGAPK